MGYRTTRRQLKALRNEQAPRIDVISERDAKLCEELMRRSPYKDKPWARLALSIAARAIRRGRLLTAGEQTENLALAFEEEGDLDIAALIRRG